MPIKIGRCTHTFVRDSEKTFVGIVVNRGEKRMYGCGGIIRDIRRLYNPISLVPKTTSYNKPIIGTEFKSVKSPIGTKKQIGKYTIIA